MKGPIIKFLSRVEIALMIIIALCCFGMIHQKFLMMQHQQEIQMYQRSLK